MAQFGSFRSISLSILALSGIGAFVAGVSRVQAATSWTLIGWNDLGMHCMDSDYSVFALLPPFNTIHAQVIDSTGKLVKSDSGLKITYEAIADPSGSINTASGQKTNFWSFVQNFFGISPPVETGINGFSTPGPANTPQPMVYEAGFGWFTAQGIPLTPYDDNLNKNPYPMFRLVARDASGNILATTRIVAPVSDEMDCRACHASGSGDAAMPRGGWTNEPNVDRDFKLNILRLHDQKQGPIALYQSTLASAGYPNGLFASASGGNPVLCAACHGSNALNAAGLNVPQLTSSIHSFHATVADPVTGTLLDDATSRSACYRCHPGSQTRCLRGAMGNAVAADGTMAIQCQNCHGSMSIVGDPARAGWFDEPNCQACHTGTAASNKGQLRFTDAFQSKGVLRQPSTTTYATNPNQPVAGLSLYRYSTGHGGLQCEACHGSTHAESVSSHPNDNLQSIDIQGFAGPLQECTACHKNGVSTPNLGPHWMHNVGTAWVSSHSNYADQNRTACQACHGTDYRGTPLSAAFTSRSLSNRFANIQTYRGYIVSCYTCHNGPGGSGTAPAAAVVTNASGAATSGQSTSIPITVTGAATQSSLRVVSQPQGGTAFVKGSAIVYQAYPDFEGSDQFTYAVLNNGKDSNLGTATVKVTAASRPAFNAASVKNAASYAAGAVAPGMIVTFFGGGLGPADLKPIRLISGGYVQKALEGTRVLFDGITSPMIYTSNGQVAAVVPYGIAGKSSTNVTVEYNGIASTAVAVPVVPAMPGIFSADASGKGQASALNEDNSFNSAANPAVRGHAVVLYLTGDGVSTPAGVDGKLVTAPYPKPALPVTVTIGGQTANVLYAGAAPALVSGLMQVNAVVPQTVNPGAAEVLVSVGNAVTPAGVTISVK